MARPAKAVATQTCAATKEERLVRLNNEKRLRGSSDNLMPPEYLTEPQKKIYNYIVDNLKDTDILGNLDAYTLEQAAITIDRIQDCEMQINAKGLVLSGKANPLIAIKKAYMADFFKLCTELSLSPQARAKLANAQFKSKENKADPLLKALAGGDI